MSLTLVTNPAYMHAAFNDVVYSVSSTNSASTNFQVGCEVKVSGVTIATKFSKYAPSASVASFDISEILSNEILNNSDGTDIMTIGSSGLYSPILQNSALNYTLTFTEWYDVAGILTADATLSVTTISSNAIYAYNMALQDNVFSPESFDQYILDGPTKKFLTNGTLRNRVGESTQVAFLTAEATVKLKYVQYNVVGGSVTTTTFATTINNNRGIVVIGSTLFPLPTTGTRIDRVTIQILNSADVAISEEKTIYRDIISCNNTMRLEFKNRLGGMDSYTFRKATSDINTRQELINVSDIWKALTVSGERTITLEGQEEDNDTLTWLGEMHTSKVVYLTDNTTRLRVAIVSSGDTLSAREPNKPKVKIRLSDPKLN